MHVASSTIGPRVLLSSFVLLWTAAAYGQNVTPAGEVSLAQQAESEPAAGYDRGFFIRSASEPFELVIHGRMQARHVYESLEGGGVESAYSLPRARLTLSGRALADGLRYKFETDFGKGFVTLKDLYMDYAFVAGRLQLRVGQFKRPFSRQQINSSGRLDLIERAITDRFFGAGRDIGLLIHNGFDRSPRFEYAVGVFNGAGDRTRLSGEVVVDLATGEGEIDSGGFSNVPDRVHPEVVARVGYNYGPIRGYREQDLEGGPLRVSVGASAAFDFGAPNTDTGAITAELDFILKANGFSASGAAYVSSVQSGGSFGDQSFEAVGFHLQAGQLIARRFQPVVRYARIAPSGADDDRQELLAGLTVYFSGHNLKLQTDGGALVRETDAGARTDYRVRSQLQFAF